MRLGSFRGSAQLASSGSPWAAMVSSELGGPFSIHSKTAPTSPWTWPRSRWGNAVFYEITQFERIFADLPLYFSPLPGANAQRQVRTRLPPPPIPVRRSSPTFWGCSISSTYHQSLMHSRVHVRSLAAGFFLVGTFFGKRPTLSKKDQHAFDRRESSIAEIK